MDSRKIWNWQLKGWPNFRYDKTVLADLETQFLHNSGILLGSYKHLSDDDKNALTVDLMSDEALKTSEIEGEYLNRDSVQSSIRRYFGFDTDHRKIPPAEQGIAEMMVNVYRNFAKPMTHTVLFDWHKMLTKGRKDLKCIGRYRTHKEPMQVVSGNVGSPKIHFEAPPSERVPREMNRFVSWFNTTAPPGHDSIPALTRSGITHLYFVCIHPFEDGNGRIGRALSEKVLSQSLGHPTLIALSHVIQKHKKAYYDMLAQSNKTNEITAWLLYFAKIILDGQRYTQQSIEFLIQKTKLYDRVGDQLNDRQKKVIARMFHEGIDGYKGGLSAENYIAITDASRATATRDLLDLVEKGVLVRTGELKSTRYFLKCDFVVMSFRLIPKNDVCIFPVLP